jgi:HSP20 family protein
MFNELFDMQEQMNRMFNEFFGDRQNSLAEGSWVPSVDVSETDAAIVVRAELPGMSQDDIELNLQDNVLTLKGEKKQESKDEQGNYHRTECCFGSFSRTFPLPATVQQEDIQAKFKDGVLEITLPKAEEAKPKKIAITAGS